MLTLPTNFETRLTATTNSGLDMSGLVVYELQQEDRTFASGSGAASTALTVDDGSDIADNDSIQIGTAAPVTVASGGGTTSITLDVARTWDDNDPVYTIIPYAPQSVTWETTVYTRLAVKQSPIINTMGTRVPECRVTFSNVNNTLRSRVEPTDLVTNRRMTIRLLVRDLSTGNFETGSVVLFRGFMQAPRRWNQDSIEITVTGLASGALAMTPSRATTDWCNVHQFADAVDCNYTSTTTASGAAGGGSSTALTVVDGSNLTNGEYITIGSGAEVLISAGGADNPGDGDGTNSITLAEARNWADTDAVAYSRCSRGYLQCTDRDRKHEFQGFRGAKNPNLHREFRAHTQGWNWRQRRNYSGPYTMEGTRLWEMVSEGSVEDLSDHSRHIPVVLGRRLVDVDPNLIEEASFQYAGGGTRTFIARFYALSEGEINELKEWYANDEAGDEVEEADPIAKVFGVYYRDGDLGTDDDETEAEYIADSTTLKRAQNRDWMSVASDPYSRTAYIVAIQETTEDNDADNMQPLSADLEGLKIQKYTAASSPTTTGSPVYTNNPIWQATALYMDQRFGAGRWLTSADFDFPVTQPAAAVCDVAQDGPICTVTANSGSSDEYEVDSTQDFQRGMTVEYDDGTPVEYEVVEIIDDSNIKLDTAQAQVIGDVITAKLPRYSCNLVLDRPEKTSDAVAQVLEHCNGYVTSDVTGRIQLRVEATGSSVATFKDTGYADGYGIIEDSFEVLSPMEGRHKSTINRVFAGFTDQDNVTDDVHASDHDDIATYGVIAEKLDFDGIDNAHTARQLATTHLGLRRDMGNGARFTVGPVGAKIQCGDIVSVTHAVPNWTAQTKRVIRTEKIGLGSSSDMLVRLTVEDYQAAPYTDITGEQRVVAGITYPTVTLAVDTAANGVVILTWTWASGTAPILGWGVFKSTATHGGAPSLSDRIFSTTFSGGTPGWGTMQRSYTYTAVDAEFDTTLYFVVRANLPPHAAVLSNEVTAIPVDVDPGGDPGSPFNMCYGGDFNDEYDWTTSTGAEVLTDPNANADAGGSEDFPFDNENNAQDGNAGTSASKQIIATVTLPDPANFVGSKWTFASATKTGRIKVVSEIVEDSANGQAQLLLQYKIGAGATQTFTSKIASWGTYGNAPIAKQTFYSETMTEDLADLTVYAYGLALSQPSTSTAHVYTIEFAELTPPFSAIANSIATLTGDDTDYAEVARPFPGRNPPSGEPVFNTGSKCTTVLWAKRADDATALATGKDVEVILRNNSAAPGETTEFALLTIAAADVTATWQPFGQYTVFTEEVSGDLEIVCRCKDNPGALVDTGSVTRGEKLWDFNPNRAEPSSEGNQLSLRQTTWPRGPWSGTGDQKTGA